MHKDSFFSSAGHTADTAKPIAGPCTAFCAENCNLPDFFHLIDSLVYDLAHLEEEVVLWRKLLTDYLPPGAASGLEDDILRNLAARHNGEETYDIYLMACGHKTDPLEGKKHSKRIRRILKGTDRTLLDIKSIFSEYSL